MKKWFYIFLLLIVGLPVIFALFKPGFYVTHDGEFNLVRLMHFYNELANGQFPVRWTYGLNYGFGSSLFTFFYPLTYYLGSLIHFFGFDFGTSLKILIGGSSIGSVLLMYVWLRRRFSGFASFFGALVFLYAPYRLLLMYVTGSFGALLSLFFLPLSFISLDKIFDGKRKFAGVLAISILGLVTAHNVTALIFFPIIFCYAIFVLLTNKNGNKYLKEVGYGFLLGLGLSAFLLIPAFTQTKTVFLSKGVAVNFRDHFPTLKQLLYSKWEYFYSVPGENDGMSFQLGLAQWGVFGIALLIILERLARRKFYGEKDRLALFFLIMFLLSIFMMLPVSDFIWEKISILPQIQFPWRILAASISLVPFLAAYISSKKLGWLLAVPLIGLLFYANRNNLRTWETIRYPDSSYVTRPSLYNGSTDIAWETRPIWVEVRPTWLAKTIVEDNPAFLVVGNQIQKSNGDIEVTLTATKSATLVLNRFYYPVWKVVVDGKETTYKPTVDKGLLSTELSPGKHEINISYKKTNTEAVADAISLSSLILLGYLFWTTSHELTK